LGKKQKQADEDKNCPAPSAGCDGFSEIPLSLPPCPDETKEDQKDPVQPANTAAEPSEKQEPSSAQTQNTSESTETLLSGLNLSAETPQVTEQQKESNREDEGVEAQVPELKTAQQTNKSEKDTQLWNQPFVTTRFGISSAPALYPSLAALEEDSVMQIYEKAVKNCAREPAVLALPEQESSPLSLQPLKAVAELSRSKLYPELPKTAPEMQAFSLEQLSVWEPGEGLRTWLEGVEVCAAQFCALAHQENHELTELLQNYWRCRRQLNQSHTQLHTQSSDCKSTQNRLWSFKDEQLTLQGVCADQAKVCGYHRFQQAEFSQTVLAELRLLFEACSELLHQKVVLHAYTALLSRLQIESYLYRLLKECSGSQTQPCSLQPLKEAISVLFSFTRRVLDDTQFQTDIHQWLERLVVVLLRIGGSGEHLYLLCHLLCCPAGVGKWAAPFLQIQVSGNSGVQHFMQALAILMSPARHRAEFLGHMKPCESQNSAAAGPESGNWTLVDEGGEEDEDPESSWLLLCEEDLISLLSQFPFQQLYSHMLGMSKQGVYEPQACSSQKMMRVFAFASSLVEILARGLQTYNRARYRQLVKRIGHIIRMTVCYVSDHWAQYVSVTDAGGSSSHVHSLTLEKLQLEYDHLFLRAVLHVLRNKRLGIWLFMSEMPYGTLSSSMLWKVLYVMQCAETAGLETLSTVGDTQSCIQALRDLKHQEKFEGWLCEVNSSDGISLLTALAHMATPTQHFDPMFITTITLLIYQYFCVSVDSARERIMSNLEKHPVPLPAPDLQQLQAPVAEVPPSCLTDSKAAARLLQQDLGVLQDQARIAVAREAQQVAMEQELLENLPLLFKNRPEQVSMALECKGKGGQPCQGAANITVTCEQVQRQEAVHNQITSLRRDVKKLQTDAMAPPPQSLAQAAVHTENFITALVNIYKAQKSPAVQQVGVSAFYQVVSFVCEDTLRHPPTRQYLSSCVEILGQVFIQGNPKECGRVLNTILEHRLLCPLLSPFFTPNAAPDQFVFLYQDVVTSLHLDTADIIFMLLTKFDLSQWLNEAHPVFSERTRLLELVHGALCVCGRDPESELLMPFHLFTKHWTVLLRHHFPDHYSDCLRLLMTSSADQLLSPECWKVTLRVLGCLPPTRSSKNKPEPSITSAVGATSSPYRSPISLSPQQVEETVNWLSDYFLRSRLSKADLRSFGLYSAWVPYISDVVTFWEHLIGCLINTQVSSCTREPVGSNKVMKALQDLHSKLANLFTPWIFPLDTADGGNGKCYPWLETDAVAAGCLVGLYVQLTDTLHHKFRDRLLPGQRGALWLCLMQYCESCTSPRTPEYLLYLYHTHLRILPWRHLHPDSQLMEHLFNVERGSPKSCFLFMGELMCEVNWVSVLSDHLEAPPSSTSYPALSSVATQKDSHTMLVYLLYMLVFLAKEEQLLTKQDSPLLSLLVQSTSLPWYQLDLSSYQGILGYVGTHYPPSLLLSGDSAPQLLLKLLRGAAGLHPHPSETPHQEETLKAGGYVSWSVKSLVTLEQGGGINLGSLEAQLETLLESVVTFNPPGVLSTCPQQSLSDIIYHLYDSHCPGFIFPLVLPSADVGLEQRHMAFCGLFSDALTLLNGVGVSTGEALAAHVITWLDRKGRGCPILPLLTACSQCLASVRHMTRIMEACITAYFNNAEEESVGWGPVLASLQVPELTMDDFLSESQSGGSFLTLYAFILQRLNSEYTAANQRRILALISTWTTQVFPSLLETFIWRFLSVSSGPGDEAKLFLWWHKALNLSVEQLQPQAGNTEGPGVIMGLVRLQTRLLQLGEERLNSGLLGAIGLGKRSPVSNKMVVRSLAAFLSIQVPSETELRLQPTTDLQLSPKAQQMLGMLESMSSNKQYAELQEALNKAIQFIRYPGHCVKDGPRLLALLVNLLYSDLRYLHVIR
ncbi:hypothetical protein CCH79_00006951, partial [Gambusia affinis]